MTFKDITIILVLYKTSLEESKTMETLRFLQESPINLIVFDNSPIPYYSEPNFQYENFNITYYQDSSNPGLSTAYNKALEHARGDNCKWLLLLDQDTMLCEAYFNELSNLDPVALFNNTVSIIPRVTSLNSDSVIAPLLMSLGGSCKPISTGDDISKKHITGINSGTLLKVSFMDSIGGFSPKYTLDMLDHWYFREIYREQKRIHILNTNIQQDLSIFSGLEGNVSLSRYKELVKAEYLYVSNESFLSISVFKLRLLYRYFKQLRYENKKYSAVTLRCLLTL